MALSYNSIQALLNDDYLPTIVNNIFKETHPFLDRLLKKAKTFTGRKIVQPVMYGTANANVAATAAYDTVSISAVDPFTAAEYEPKMITASISISDEEENEMNAGGAQKVKDIVDAKVMVTKMSLQQYFEDMVFGTWTSAASWGTKKWNPLDLLVHATNTPVGGIAVSDASWWVSKTIDGSALDEDMNEANLLNSSSPCYLPTLIQRGYAKAGAKYGKPTCILLPQYHFDLLERIEQAKKGSRDLKEDRSKLGFEGFMYRGNTVIMPEDALLNYQSSDTDGRIYILNENFIDMRFNSKAKFKAKPFIAAQNGNFKTSLINAFGNMTISNRAAQCVITNVYSPADYSS